MIGGSFTDSLAITTGSGQTNIKSKGGTDAILIKLAAGGDTEWVKQFGGRYDDTILHLAVDANGNIFVQGVFKDVADWGGEPLKAGGGSDNDVVLAKYDTNGDHVWSQRFGNAFNEVAGGVAVDPAGNVTIAGSFENKGSISFGEKRRSRLARRGRHLRRAVRRRRQAASGRRRTAAIAWTSATASRPTRRATPS